MSLRNDLKLIGEAIETIDLVKHGNYYSFTVNPNEKGLKFVFYTPLLAHHYFNSAADLITFIDTVVKDLPKEFKFNKLMPGIKNENHRLPLYFTICFIILRRP